MAIVLKHYLVLIGYAIYRQLETLRRVWIQQYYCQGDKIRWRKQADAPPASIMISSPYDCDAHYAKKKTTSWVGYKVHISETCEPGA